MQIPRIVGIAGAFCLVWACGPQESKKRQETSVNRTSEIQETEKRGNPSGGAALLYAANNAKAQRFNQAKEMLPQFGPIGTDRFGKTLYGYHNAWDQSVSGPAAGGDTNASGGTTDYTIEMYMVRLLPSSPM